MNPTRKIPILLIVFLVLLLGGLFYSSSLPYDKQNIQAPIGSVIDEAKWKQRVGDISFEYVGKEVSVETYGVEGFIEFFIRKATHFTTFAVLAAVLYHIVKRYSNPSVAIPWSAFLTTLIAILDEWHQSFTPNRTSLVADVLVDTAGAVTALGVTLLWGLIRTRRQKGQA